MGSKSVGVIQSQSTFHPKNIKNRIKCFFTFRNKLVNLFIPPTQKINSVINFLSIMHVNLILLHYNTLHKVFTFLDKCQTFLAQALNYCFSYRSRVVRKAWEADKISEKWAESAWAKRMEMKRRRQGLNDFDRFKLYKAKSARNKILAKAVNIKKNKLTKAGKLSIVFRVAPIFEK